MLVPSAFNFYGKGCNMQDVLNVPTLTYKVSSMLKYSGEVSVDIKEQFKKNSFLFDIIAEDFLKISRWLYIFT